MSTRSISKRPFLAIATTAGALALLLNFRTPDAGLASSAAGQSAAQTGGAASQGVAARSQSPAAVTTAAKSGTFTGSTVQSRYGPVQVQITISNGKITAAQAIQSPSSDPHSSQVSQYAIPTLVQETLQAQSAQVNTVSGATYTSQAYKQSLQSALDQAAA